MHKPTSANSGKTRIRNASGQQPPNIETFGPEVWVGSTSQPRHEQGLTVLGAPVGSTEYKQHHLQHLRTEHDKLLQQLPHLQDLQASWLLLLYCASPRCIYQLRMLPPNITAQFSQDHDAAVAACLSELLDAGAIPATSLAIAHLPLSQGGVRTHLSQCHSHSSALGFVGRYFPSPLQPDAATCRDPFAPVATPH